MNSGDAGPGLRSPGAAPYACGFHVLADLIPEQPAARRHAECEPGVYVTALTPMPDPADVVEEGQRLVTPCGKPVVYILPLNFGGGRAEYAGRSNRRHRTRRGPERGRRGTRQGPRSGRDALVERSELHAAVALVVAVRSSSGKASSQTSRMEGLIKRRSTGHCSVSSRWCRRATRSSLSPSARTVR